MRKTNLDKIEQMWLQIKTCCPPKNNELQRAKKSGIGTKITGTSVPLRDPLCPYETHQSRVSKIVDADGQQGPFGSFQSKISHTKWCYILIRGQYLGANECKLKETTLNPLVFGVSENDTWNWLSHCILYHWFTIMSWHTSNMSVCQWLLQK